MSFVIYRFYFEFLFTIEVSEVTMSDAWSILSRLHDSNVDQKDENMKIGMILEAHASIRNKLKQYALDLAEKLDATIAKQAEEKAAYQSHVQEKIDIYRKKCEKYERVLDDLVKSEISITMESWKNELELRSINKRMWTIAMNFNSILLCYFVCV